jgi:hypothetical protein
MTKTTPTTKKSTAVAKDKSKAAAEPKTSSLPAPTLDPEQARKDIAAMIAKASVAARAKAN